MAGGGWRAEDIIFSRGSKPWTQGLRVAKKGMGNMVINDEI